MPTSRQRVPHWHRPSTIYGRPDPASWRPTRRLGDAASWRPTRRLGDAASEGLGGEPGATVQDPVAEVAEGLPGDVADLRRPGPDGRALPGRGTRRLQTEVARHG